MLALDKIGEGAYAQECDISAWRPLVKVPTFIGIFISCSKLLSFSGYKMKLLESISL